MFANITDVIANEGDWPDVGFATGFRFKLFFLLKKLFSLAPVHADPGCLSRIPDPTFFHPGSRIRICSIPDPESTAKNLNILTQKNCF
jgi:hypothetical protein